MAVTFRSAGASAGVSTGTTLTLDVPPSIVAGDYLIAFVHSQATTATSDWTPPSGWTKIGPDFTPSSSPQRVTSMFAKFATGSEPTTYTFTSPISGARSVGVIHAYTGVDATTPVAASSGFSALAATAATLDVSAFSAADGRYTIEMTTAQYASPNSYALSSYTGGLALTSSVFRASGTIQDPPSEDTTVSRTAMHIWQGVPAAGGVPAHVITSAGSFTQRCAALISLNAAGSGGGTVTVTPSIVGHTAASSVSMAGSTFDIDGSTVAVGDWIIVTLSTAGNMTSSRQPTPPAGWTTIVPFQSPGTGYYTFGVWAHRRAVGETTYTWSQTTTEVNGLASRLIMVRNADDIANWTIGTIGTRAASGGTITTTAPSITTIRAHTLGLLLAGERTTATETDEQVTCDNFTKQWFENDRDHSIFVATKDMVTSGSTGDVTVTYPNTQAQNGIALIIGISGVLDPTAGLPISYFAIV